MAGGDLAAGGRQYPFPSLGGLMKRGDGGVCLEVEFPWPKLIEKRFQNPGDELVRPEGGGVVLDYDAFCFGDPERLQRALLRRRRRGFNNIHLSGQIRMTLGKILDTLDRDIKDVLRHKGVHAAVEGDPVAGDVVFRDQLLEKVKRLQLKGGDAGGRGVD